MPDRLIRSHLWSDRAKQNIFCLNVFPPVPSLPIWRCSARQISFINMPISCRMSALIYYSCNHFLSLTCRKLQLTRLKRRIHTDMRCLYWLQHRFCGQSRFAVGDYVERGWGTPYFHMVGHGSSDLCVSPSRILWAGLCILFVVNCRWLLLIRLFIRR